MSATSLEAVIPRSASGRREALLIVAHGDCGGTRDNRLANLIAGRMHRSGRFQDVAVGYMRAAPDVAAAAAGLDGKRVRIFPLFMSDGYYVRRAIPERLGIAAGGLGAHGRRYSIMTPVGLGARMPEIVSAGAEVAGRRAGFEPGASRLLVVAHGSGNDPASRQAAEALAAGIHQRGRFAAVDTAFLEEPPLLADQLAALPGPLVVTGYFIGEGMHGAEDMAEAIARAGRTDIVAAAPLSRSTRLIEAICEDIEAATAEWGGDPPRSSPH